LEACNGQITLREFESRFGARGLELVAQLYKKGLVELLEGNDQKGKQS